MSRKRISKEFGHYSPKVSVYIDAISKHDLRKLKFTNFKMLAVALILICASLAAGQAPVSSSGETYENIFPVSEPPTAVPGPVSSGQRNGTCEFVMNTARYYQVVAEATLQGVENDTLVNDALIRLLRGQLLLSSCQLVMSEGANCTSGTTSLPCADPIFQCGNGIVISKDVYNAVLSGSCEGTANNTLVCGVIATNPEIPKAVVSGACKPTCISAGGLQTAQSLPASCLSYQITIDNPSEAQAQEVAAQLVSPSLSTAITTGLAGFASSDMKFLIVDSQVAPTVGFGNFPPPPPPLRAISPADASLPENATAASLAAAGVLAYGPWTNCTPACGDGFRTRTASCFAPDGTLLPLRVCPNGSQAVTYQSCSESSCPDAYWTYSSWSACSATCGGGFSSRQATCTSPSGAECSTPPEDPSSTPCNTAPCQSFSWQVSSWGECNAPCGEGTRTRTVECVDSTGSPSNTSACIGRKPASSEKCNIQACDFCANNPCLGRGTCSNGACQCRNGYSGVKCEIPASCNSGIVDVNLACCASGLVNAEGVCCPLGSRLDATGECCDQPIDVCGQCGGNGLFIDMQGICCTVADANGVCCKSGLIDECGVCDGVGNSCDIVLGTTIQVPASMVMGSGVQVVPITTYFQDAAASVGIPPESVSVGQVSVPSTTGGRRRLTQVQTGEVVNSTTSAMPMVPLVVDVMITPSNTTTSTSTVPFSSAYLAASLSAAAANNQSATTPDGISLVGTATPGREAVCGNGICEIGERPTIGAQNGTCPGDCGLPAQTCTGGCGVGGNCLPASGVCQCYHGYLGPNCVQCAQGYIMSGGVCVTSVTAWNLVNSSVVNAQGEATVNGGEGGGSNTGVIVGATIGGVIALVLVIVGICMLRSRCCDSSFASVGKMDGPHSAQFMYSGNAKGDGTGVDEHSLPEQQDEELGLRYKYGVAGPQFLGPASARTYQVHVAAGPTAAAGDGRSAPGDEGWYSAREDYTRERRPTQSMHYEGSGPMGDFLRHSTRSLPAHADSFPAHADSFPAHADSFPPHADSFPAHAELQGSSQRNFDDWGGAMAHMNAGSVLDAPDHLRSSRATSSSHISGPPQPPHPPSARDDVRSSRLSLRGTSDEAPSGSGSASAAVSFPGDEDDPLRASSSTLAVDSRARLFFNPAFSVEAKMRTAAVEAFAAQDYIAARPRSARQASAASTGDSAQDRRPLTARSYRTAEVSSPEHVEDRRAKLQALREAVRSLEEQRRMATMGHYDDQNYNNADLVDGSSAQEITLHGKGKAPAAGFLPGRPTVPRLALGTLDSKQLRPPARSAASGSKQQQQQPSLQHHQLRTAPSDPELIKAHLGPDPAAEEARRSPGAAFAHGAKSFLRTIATSLTPSPGGNSKRKMEKRKKHVDPSPKAQVVAYEDVMAAVDGALQRSAGNSPAKQSARGSARSQGSGRGQAVGAVGNRQPWRV